MGAESIDGCDTNRVEKGRQFITISDREPYTAWIGPIKGPMGWNDGKNPRD